MRNGLRHLETDGITHEIIGGAIEVHRYLGPGMLEHTYEVWAYRIDMLVEGQVVVELKVVRQLAPVHVSQVLSYLRLAELEVGLLFNFNVEALSAGGWKRILRTR